MNSLVSPPDSHFSHSVELNPTSIESKPQPNSQTSWMASRGSSSSSFRGRGGRNSPKGRGNVFVQIENQRLISSSIASSSSSGMNTDEQTYQEFLEFMKFKSKK
ncbi:hypothetical protein P3S68_030210 [Capsicum galapagoense]